MAPTFRYRYVDVGTVFTGDSHHRDAHAGADSPATLFANELACDVGGSSWGPNQPLAIIDHHLVSANQFPSASAAVLHKSSLLRERFSPADHVIWLVTNNEPEFDAFCSLYLARRIIEDPAVLIDWQSYDLDAEGWSDVPGPGKFDWFQPDLTNVPWERRWPLLLANYASLLDMRRPIPCPRARALRSVLYAALKRGRDYLSETSGATEFFDEVRACIQEKQLNPVFDSVFEERPQFAPELAMLDREAETYQRDLERARKALVFLPEAEAPTPDFFEHRNRAAQPASTELDGQNLLLADSFRIATDGIYLRDPECALFKEWARVDLENSALGAGFEFTAIAYSNQRPPGAANTSEYVFSIDPERANGRHLYTLWSRLETEEVEAFRTGRELAVLETSTSSGGGPGGRTETLQTLLSDPWFGGHNRSSTRVETPGRGTLIGPAGVRGDLRDDPVVEAVRTELEAPIYRAASAITGPQITVIDFAASAGGHDVQPRPFDMNAPLSIPPPQPGYFRFAAVELRADVPIAPNELSGDRLARQIGENLWHALHPDARRAVPQDFGRHLVIAPDEVGVWSERGVAVAQKARALQVDDPDNLEQRDFAELISLLRDIDQFAADWKSLQSSGLPPQKRAGTQSPGNGASQLLAAEGEDLARRALEVQHILAQPGRDLLRQFCEAIGFEQLAHRLRELNQVITERLRRQEAEQEGRRRESRALEVAHLRSKLKWLELFVIGFVALEVIGMVARNVPLGNGAQQTLVWLGGPLVLACAAWLLQPGRSQRSAGQKEPRLKWILISALLVWLAAWVSQVLATH
jgi:hypothetical protein